MIYKTNAASALTSSYEKLAAHESLAKVIEDPSAKGSARHAAVTLARSIIETSQTADSFDAGVGRLITAVEDWQKQKTRQIRARYAVGTALLSMGGLSLGLRNFDSYHPSGKYVGVLDGIVRNGRRSGSDEVTWSNRQRKLLADAGCPTPETLASVTLSISPSSIESIQSQAQLSAADTKFKPYQLDSDSEALSALYASTPAKQVAVQYGTVQIDRLKIDLCSLARLGQLKPKGFSVEDPHALFSWISPPINQQLTSVPLERERVFEDAVLSTARAWFESQDSDSQRKLLEALRQGDTCALTEMVFKTSRRLFPEGKARNIGYVTPWDSMGPAVDEVISSSYSPPGEDCVERADLYCAVFRVIAKTYPQFSDIRVSPIGNSLESHEYVLAFRPVAEDRVAVCSIDSQFNADRGDPSFDVLKPLLFVSQNPQDADKVFDLVATYYRGDGYSEDGFYNSQKWLSLALEDYRTPKSVEAAREILENGKRRINNRNLKPPYRLESATFYGENLDFIAQYNQLSPRPFSLEDTP